MIKNKLNDKAELFHHLATMENAGVPLIQAVETLLPNKNSKLNKSLIQLLSKLKRGSPLSTAGLSSGLFSNIDSLIIKAATDSGTLAEALKRLARQYETKLKLKQKVKSQLVFPVFIFILAIFIAPIPSLVSNSIDSGTYVDVTVFFLIKLFLILAFLSKLPFWLRKGFLSSLGLAISVDKLIMNSPITGKLYVKHQVTQFIETLAALLQAGIPAFDALPRAIGIIDNSCIKASFEPVLLRLKSNSTLHDSIVINDYLSDECKQHIKSGELSGRLDESLLHYGELARAEVNFSFEQFALWVPRIIYGIICMYMVYSIFSSNAFLPSA